MTSDTSRKKHGADQSMKGLAAFEATTFRPLLVALFWHPRPHPDSGPHESCHYYDVKPCIMT